MLATEKMGNRLQVDMTHATDVELPTLLGAQHEMLDLVEETEALDTMTLDTFKTGQTISARWPEEKS